MQNPRVNYKITEIVKLRALLRIIVSINLNILSQKDQLSQVVMVFLDSYRGCDILHINFTLISKSDIWYLLSTENNICFRKNIKITFTAQNAL